MNPDLNQLRRDLGLTAPNQSQDEPTTISNVHETAPAPTPGGLTLNSVGMWLLSILGIVIGVWLLADPICMLLVGVFHMICAILSFILTVVGWIVVGCIILWVIGSVFS